MVDWPVASLISPDRESVESPVRIETPPELCEAELDPIEILPVDIDESATVLMLKSFPLERETEPWPTSGTDDNVDEITTEPPREPEPELMRTEPPLPA